MSDTVLRQAAFTAPDRKMLKGGLHCHTTRSDGEGSPAAVEQLHLDHGYDFLAITDHSRYNRENYLPDSDLLIVPAMEMNCGWDVSWGQHHFHAVAIGPDNEQNGFDHDEELPYANLDDPHDFQRYVDKAVANNNLVIYCHPQWSGTPVRDFEFLDGIVAMELWNSGCAIDLDRDTDNGIYWDELLGRGRIIWGVASDDGHGMHHHCHGWVMVNAEKSVPAILQALKEGAFYASCGPEIYDFYVDEAGAHLHCSPCHRVVFYCDKHNFPQHISEEKNLTHAVNGVNNARYIRACAIDAEGRKAWTNPIFLDGR